MRSRPAAGFVQQEQFGRRTSARASRARSCRSPLESVPKARSRSTARPTRPQASAAAAWTSSSYECHQGASVACQPVTTTSCNVRPGSICWASPSAPYPIRGRRRRTSVVPSRSPRTVTDPVDGCVRSAAIASRVDFPDPLAPRTTQRWSESTDQSIGPTNVVEPRVTVAPSRVSTVGRSEVVASWVRGTAPSVEDRRHGDFNPYARGRAAHVTRGALATDWWSSAQPVLHSLSCGSSTTPGRAACSVLAELATVRA